MKLQLFNFIEDTISYFEKKTASYEYVEGKLKEFYTSQFVMQNTKVVSMHSRIKGTSSLKEKLIRNEFYLDYDTPEEAIENLSDLIGITLECRFIRNEHEIYESLFQFFNETEKGYAVCKMDSSIYLNLKQPQPQTQRNGFTIYRIDGYYLFNGEKVNYELQIKSLVHNFWSDIEHEVVYKNPDFVMYDAFNQSMLGAIRDNLDVVDRQLEIMYNEISYESNQAQIGMDEKGFKVFIARSINELVNRKLKDSLGFATDFKKCSAIIAQYIYIHDFVNGKHNRETMIDYFTLLNLLNNAEMDFSETIELENSFDSEYILCKKLGNYWLSQVNSDFSWHIFFAMLFQIQPGNNAEDFKDFCEIIRILLIQPGWYLSLFENCSESERQEMRDVLENALADGILSIGNIEMIHEDKVYDCMIAFRTYVNQLKVSDITYQEFMDQKEKIENKVHYIIRQVFRK